MDELDDLHRMILEDLIKQYRIDGLSEKETDGHMSGDACTWPGSIEGLTRLKKKYILWPIERQRPAYDPPGDIRSFAVDGIRGSGDV